MSPMSIYIYILERPPVYELYNLKSRKARDYYKKEHISLIIFHRQ